MAQKIGEKKLTVDGKTYPVQVFSLGIPEGIGGDGYGHRSPVPVLHVTSPDPGPEYGLYLNRKYPDRVKA